MSQIAEVATPFYLLKHGDRSLGPACIPQGCGKECSASYGFAGKEQFDIFRDNCRLELTPYPLVKVFLRNCIEATNGGLHLIVLNAPGPDAVSLYAATAQAVLEVHENRSLQLMATHCLTFDDKACTYRVTEIETRMKSA